MTNPLLVAAMARRTADLSRDPLAAFVFHSEKQREAARWVCMDIETYVRTPNKGGKTYLGAALFGSFARGRRKLADLELPALPLPNVGVVLVQSYKQAEESVIAHIRRALGRGNYKRHRISGSTYTGSMKVATPKCKHEGGKDECEDCSTIYIVSGDGEVPAGFQVDWIWADEPPSRDHWSELRSRSRANSPLYSMVTATPIKKADYAWLQEDFAECLGKPVDGRVEVVWGLGDNRFLTAKYIERQKKRWKNDPYFRARFYGEYVDVTGTCPFDYEGLGRWLKRAEAGRTYAVVAAERDGEQVMVLREHPQGIVQVWEEPCEGEFYLLAADPAAGVRDPDKSERQQPNNPTGMNMVSVGGRRHVVRVNGYIAPAEAGHVARAICRHFGDRVMFVPEMNAGWGDTMMQTFGYDYPHLYVDVRLSDTSRHRARKIGWYQTRGKRASLVSALQRAVVEDSLDVRSAELVRHLMNVEVTPNKRPGGDDIVEEGKGRGSHGEDMVTLGICCELLERPEYQKPVAVAAEETPGDLRYVLRRQASVDEVAGYGGRER